MKLSQGKNIKGHVELQYQNYLIWESLNMQEKINRIDKKSK